MKKTVYLLALLFTTYMGANAQDLTPSSVSFNYDFQTAIISNLEVEVENLDNFSVTDDYLIQVYVDGIGTVTCLGAEYQVDWFTDGSVPGNGFLTYAFPNIDLDNLDNTCGLPTGNYHLRVVLDVNNDVDEDNETNNEESFTSQNFSFESLVSIDPKDHLADVKLYPNPAQDNFYIQRGEYFGDLQIELLAMDGRILDTQVMEAGQAQQEMQVANYPTGIYLVRIQGDGKQHIQKLMVQ